MNEDRQLWDLLGRCPRPSAPPFFTAKVMRQIEGRRVRPSWLAAALRWLAPASIAALAVFALLPRSSAPAAGADDTLTTLDLVEMVSPDDYLLLTSAAVSDDDDFLTAGL